jgi:hypothetical protein
MSKVIPKFRIKWPEGSQIKLESEHLLTIRRSLEAQFKYYLYSQPNFKNFHKEGKYSFFQHFQTEDGIDFGVINVFWDSSIKDDNIDYIDSNGNIMEKSQGGWRSRWFTRNEFDGMNPEFEPRDEEFEKQFFESSELNLKKLQQQEEFEKFELEGDEPKYLN